MLQYQDLLTSRNLQRGRFLPRGTCNGKTVTSAAIAHHFLERLELMGFGKRRIVGKKHVFQRHYWEELSFASKEKLKGMGISQDIWVGLVFLQNSLLLGSELPMSRNINAADNGTTPSVPRINSFRAADNGASAPVSLANNLPKFWKRKVLVLYYNCHFKNFQFYDIHILHAD